jgi:hypothetical protein
MTTGKPDDPAGKRHNDWAAAAVAQISDAAKGYDTDRHALLNHPHRTWRETQLTFLERYKYVDPFQSFTPPQAANFAIGVINDTIRSEWRGETASMITDADKMRVVRMLAHEQGVYANVVADTAGKDKTSIFDHNGKWQTAAHLVYHKMAELGPERDKGNTPDNPSFG